VDQALHEGSAALVKHQYAAAAASANYVLAHPRAPRQNDALLMLARAEAGQAQYRPAAVDFYKTYKKAPKAGTAPLALFGMATSLIALKDTRDACEALAKLKNEFPKLPGLKPNYIAAHRKAGCH
jgi:TolA-binding protein